MLYKFSSLYISKYYALKFPNFGRNFKVCHGTYISAPKHAIEIGCDFFANVNCYLSTNNNTRVKIGDAVMFGPNVHILGGNHNLSATECHLRYYLEPENKCSEILLENGVWVGAMSIILGGATLGEGAVLAAGSVLNGSIPPYSIAAGVPAKVKKRRFSTKAELELILSNTNSNYTVSELELIYEKFGI
ncbi:acyltransferase [Pseudoalteromonas byunsanensis]|uniref:Galactoside O-acetyltransferase n=1 Tax=Pseudoalteromonas byunsanensis TaxID=327939 RepID=A0A1S1N7C8_9GAMM|nr:hypothetical protein [Pseudoalteromonas byunsanensis]OHU95270.1 hypothetical protein BIW53_11160 [Pseudoalteromonas byunsanensis]